MTSLREVEFFGGPYHGMKLDVPDEVNTLDMAEVEPPEFISLQESGVLPTSGMLIVRYTRVHNRHTPTNQFEYIGRAI